MTHAAQDSSSQDQRTPALCPADSSALLFAPGQLDDSIRVVVVDTLTQLRDTAATWGGQPVDDDMQACCCIDYDADGSDLGCLIFAREKLTRPIVVHELVHAGMGWVAVRSMTSDEVQAMSDREQQEYYDEACARVVEHLYEQAEAILWPNVEMGNSDPNKTS